MTVERFVDARSGCCPSSSISISSFSASESESSVAPSASNTCGNGCGECGLDLVESVLERNDSPPLDRVESTRCLLPFEFESILGLDSGTGGVGVTPDAAPLPLAPVLTENLDDMDILLAMENLEYR